MSCGLDDVFIYAMPDILIGSFYICGFLFFVLNQSVVYLEEKVLASKSNYQTEFSLIMMRGDYS